VRLRLLDARSLLAKALKPLPRPCPDFEQTAIEQHIGDAREHHIHVQRVADFGASCQAADQRVIAAIPRSTSFAWERPGLHEPDPPLGAAPCVAWLRSQ